MNEVRLGKAGEIEEEGTNLHVRLTRQIVVERILSTATKHSSPRADKILDLFQINRISCSLMNKQIK